MQIESAELKAILFKLKQEAMILLDRKLPPKVRSSLDNRVGVIDAMLIWISKSEQQGELNMETLKLGELTTWEPKRKEGSIDSLIIEESKALKKNRDAIKINVKTINWTTLQNRTYALRKDNKIKENVVPRKDENGIPHLVYLDPPPVKRSMK